MKSHFLLAALACAALIASPAYAAQVHNPPPPPHFPGLSVNDAINQFGAGGCTVGANGNQCSLKPDVTPASGHFTTPSTGPSPTYCDGRIGYWDVTSFQAPNGHWVCYAAINPHNSAGAFVLDTAATCSITTREISHNPKAPFDQGWSVSSSKSSC